MRLRLDPFSQNGISSVQSNTTIIGTGTTTTGGGGASSLADLTDVDSTVASPSDGDIIVYRDAGSDWVLEAKPAGGSNPALNDVTDVTISAVADNEVLAYDSGTTTWINQTASEAGLAAASHTHTESDITDLGTYQVQLAEGAFVNGDKTKLDGIEAGADVTDTANVTAAGALMDSEVTNLAQVKAFNSADYATAAQGALADSALQNITGENIADLSNVVVTTPADNEVMAYDTTSGNWINQTASEAGIAAASHTHTASQVTDFDTEVSNNTDVAANTAARHDPVTVSDTSEIDLTLTGQQISGAIVAGSIDETKLDTSTNASLDLADSSVQPGDNISTLTNDSGFTSNTGDVVGPASATDNALTRFNLTTGKVIQESDITLADNGTFTNTATNGNIEFVTNGTGAVFANGSLVATQTQINSSIATHSADTTSVHGIADTSALQLQPIEGAFVDGDKTKLDGIEAEADVTDTANVTAAGALMDSEVDADIKTLSLPANTTISTFGASLVDDADAATARTTLGLGNVDNTSDATKKADIIGTIYPVGSIYISVNSTNPNTVLGLGTWVAFGEGKVLVGLDSGDTDFDTAEETGGAKTHTLTESEIPGHTHSTVNGGTLFVGASGSNRNITVNTVSGTGNLSGTGPQSASTSSTGSGSAHNNLQPYIVVYMFKRTA